MLGLNYTKANVNEQIRESTWSLGCFHYLSYEDRWTIKYDKLKYIKDFLKEENIQDCPEYNISLDMLSSEKLREYISELPKKFALINNDEFLVFSYKKSDVERNFDLYLVQEYSDILRMRIFPQDGALIGLQFDVFGFWKDITKDLPKEALGNQRDSRRFFRGRTAFPGKRVNVKSVSRVRISPSLLLKDWFSIDYNPKNIFFVRH